MGNKLCSCNFCVSQQILNESNLSNPPSQIQFSLSKTDTSAKRDINFIDIFEESPTKVKNKSIQNLFPIKNLAIENKFYNKINLVTLKIFTQKVKQFSDLYKKKCLSKNQNNNSKLEERANEIFEKMNKLNLEAKNKNNAITPKQETIVMSSKNMKTYNSIQDDALTQEIEDLKKGLSKKQEVNHNNSTNVNSSDNSEIWKNETKPTQNSLPKKNYIFKNKQKVKNNAINSKKADELHVSRRKSITSFGNNNFGNNQPLYEQNNNKESIDFYNKKTSIDNSSNHNNGITISFEYKDMMNFHSDNLSFNEYE